MVEVTQADRLLLADLFDLPQESARQLYAGEHDNKGNIATKLQAIARHRTAADERVKALEAVAQDMLLAMPVLATMLKKARLGNGANVANRMLDAARRALGEG